MGSAGRKSIIVELHDTTFADVSKRYTIVLEKKFELFNIIREHLGNIRVVHNNPALNGHGLTFSTCDWYRWSWERSSWELVDFGHLYYTAGPSIRNDKFSDLDSMYVVLRTAPDNIRLETCPAVSKDSIAYANDSSSAGSDKKAVELSVYPNPVAAGGTIKLKQAEFIDSEQEQPATFYLIDAQGRLVLTGSASALRDGLTMPEAPGVYHLILEGKSGRKVVKVAVGQRS
jgi:hypothetical protein